ncbi:MAG: hypothetical protein ACI4BB_10380 [Coprococcus sp.]
MDNKINEGALTKHVKTLVLQERYEEALKVLDDIDVSRIKNMSILCLVGEVYMGLKRYDEAEQILLRVYEKNPNTRRILDLLTTLYIDKGEYSEAEYYYKEFIGVASRDLHRYILRYRLDKGKGERLSVLIDTLEKLKDYEYIEEWAYELATLYEASGETKKCIHECDEIVLWFGHGEYVDKAIALKCKLTGQPLPEITTVEQHRAEEERLAAASESTQNTENPAADDYEGSIDVELIQKVLDERSSQNAADNIAADNIAADNIAADSIPAENEPEEMVDDKSHIAQLFSSLMFSRSKEKENHFDWTTARLGRDEEEEPVQPEETLDVADSVDSQDVSAPDDEDDMQDSGDELVISMEGLSQEDVDFFGKLMGTDFDADAQGETDDMQDEADDDQDEADSESVASQKDYEDEMTDDEMEDDDEIIGDIELSLDDLFGLSDHASADPDEVPDDEVINDEVIDEEDEDQEIIDEADGAIGGADEDEIIEDIQASDTVMDIFGSVAGVQSIKNQLAKTFTRFEDPALDNMDLLAPYDINFVVTGYDMSVKSQIAIGIAKALNTYGICDKNKLVRATADDLNGRDFTGIFEKLKSGCLIIEGADRLNDRAAGIIVDFVQRDNQDVAIVLEGEEERIKELFKKYPVLHSKFLNIIHIGKYNENELVELAWGYAEKKGYEMSEPAADVLKRLLRERMRDGYSVNYEDIMAIIEEAIASLEKRNMKNLFMTVLDNKYEEAAMFMLQPEDFDNINIPD